MPPYLDKAILAVLCFACIGAGAVLWTLIRWTVAFWRDR